MKIFQAYKRPLILDGAMGSLMQQKGLTQDPYLWYSKYNLDKAAIVKSLHKDYILAGADIITTNTFRTNPISVKSSNYDIPIKELVKKSVEIAIKARDNYEVIIAGSNAPAEDCYKRERTISRTDLDDNHKTHIELLWNSGVDVIWNETQSHLDEIEIICKYCSKNNLPYVVNLFFDDELKLLSGEKLHEAVKFIAEFNPLAIGFNCIKINTLIKYTESYLLPDKWGFYFNCGAGNIEDEEITCGITPTEYIKSFEPFMSVKPKFIGSCCGSSPAHTYAIKEYFNEIFGN